MKRWLFSYAWQGRSQINLELCAGTFESLVDIYKWIGSKPSDGSLLHASEITEAEFQDAENSYKIEIVN